jgi:Ca-activated chloride channel family protein
MDMQVSASHPVLVATAISGHLEGLLGEIRITQTFANTETNNLEAVFTFPVPLEAVLLGVSVQIDERRLEGRIMPRAEAEEQYEEAIVAGDGAIRLQDAGPGRYTINVGNLLPGQTARLEYRYGLLGTWSGETWRLLIPTTLAPRYGSARGAGLQPHQIPEVSVTADHRFTLDLTLSGVLATASVSSPSHLLRVSADEQRQQVCLASEAAPLDRDLVLLLQTTGAGRNAHALLAPDGDGAVALVTVQPAFPAVETQGGRSLVVVADCSGSMAGVSIEQTREALAVILDRLTPEDHLNLIAFGSQPRARFPRLQAVNPTLLDVARHWVETLQADLGGTEMHSALDLAYQQGDGRPIDILLITDGEVWGVEALVASARDSGHRLFTVGVGAAVAEDLIRGLAESSGGAAVLVHPNEAMAEQIVRQFERMRAPRATVALRWPADPAWARPTDTRPCFDGDTLHQLAGWPHAVDGVVGLSYRREDGTTQAQALELAPWPASAPADLLPRLAAARRLAGLPEAQARALAVTYQLVTPLTDLLMIDTRDAATRATTLPHLRPVQQVLAAGWGGMGSVARGAVEPFGQRHVRARAEAHPMASYRRAKSAAPIQEPPAMRSRAPNEPALEGMLRPDTQAVAPPPAPTTTHRSAVVAWLTAHDSSLADPAQPLPSLDTVARACGLPDPMRADIQRLIDEGAPADAVIATLLIALLYANPGLGLCREAVRRLRFESTRTLPRRIRSTIEAPLLAWWSEAAT